MCALAVFYAEPAIVTVVTIIINSTVFTTIAKCATNTVITVITSSTIFTNMTIYAVHTICAIYKPHQFTQLTQLIFPLSQIIYLIESFTKTLWN